MLYDRREQILAMLKKDGSVKVAALVKTFCVSIETIRRDLEALEKEGLLRRVYGGAVLTGRRSIEPLFQDRQGKNMLAKERIGRAAAELVENGDVIGIDIGTTTMELACALLERDLQIIVITNSIPIAAMLSSVEKIEVILIGGRVRGNELAVGGHMLTEMNMNLFHTDKFFLGVGGITEKFGITDYREEETAFRRIGVERTKEVIALADHSKFGVTAMNHICDPERIDVVVTDGETGRDMLSALRARNVNVIVAE
ncbi:MAG: DeoR/GlpR transcriptional regulator [Lachnospiraceae bacterium]|nr:DeoR/GlpR transcriptional regulator [Lachnospiraceae bacterium]